MKDAVTTDHWEDCDSMREVNNFKGQQKCWEYNEVWINIQILCLQDIKFKNHEDCLIELKINVK